jgi:HAD superfamily hydrolase (TIGR01509 family)
MRTQAKAVVFDLGKVLLDFDYGIAVRRLLPQVRLGLGQMNALINQSNLLFDYETGRLSTAEFFGRVREATGYRGDLVEFGSMFADIFTAIEPMVAVHGELRRCGVPVYLLSNTNELAIARIRREFGFYAEFEGHVLSYEHGSMKPDPRLYEVVEERSGLSGPELFYLDDRPENVEAAWRRGWQALVHETPGGSRAALVAAGLLNGGGPV